MVALESLHGRVGDAAARADLSAAANFGALAADAAAMPASPDLLALIDAHRRADAAVDDAYKTYYVAYNRFLELVEPIAADGAPFDPLHIERSREKHAAEGAELATALARARGAAPKALRARFDDFQAELTRIRSDAIEDLCARTCAARQVSGLEVAEAGTDAAEKIERAALARLCGHPCAALDDVRAMAAYLVPIDGALEPADVAALLRVFAGLSPEKKAGR